MVVVELIVFAVLAAIGAVPVVGLAWVVRRGVWRRASLAASLAVSHASIVSVCMALGLSEAFWPPEPFDDVYFPFMLVPGLHIYMVGGALGQWIARPFRSGLLGTLSYHAESLVVLLIIPGIVCLILGTLQWYVIGRLMQRLIDRRARSRRGLCQKCGYDLRGSPAGGACPECGMSQVAAAK